VTQGGATSPALEEALERAAGAAARLRDVTPPVRRPAERPCLGLVSCLYDTAYRPLDAQILTRVQQLARASRAAGWRFHYVIVDDSRGARARLEIERGLDQARAMGFTDTVGVARRLALDDASDRDQKGRALLAGFRSLLDRDPCALYGYANLNNKVHLGQLPSLLEAFDQDAAEVVIGTRDPREGGVVEGAGVTGRLKSRAYNRIAHLLLPPLGPYRDTNAPLKLARAAAIRHLLTVARVDDLCFDTEWLIAFHEARFRVSTRAIVWTQEHGSRPPWRAVFKALTSLWQQRRRWRHGDYQTRPQLDLHTTSIEPDGDPPPAPRQL
jgi:hypothetical protein